MQGAGQATASTWLLQLGCRWLAHAFQTRAHATCSPPLRRLVYLDADMLVLRSIDCLFELPPGFYAGVLCCAVLCGLEQYLAARVEEHAHAQQLVCHACTTPYSAFALPATAPDCAAGRETQAERDACSLFCAEQPSYFNAGWSAVPGNTRPEERV